MKYPENSMIENWLAGYNTAMRLRHTDDPAEHSDNRRIRAAYEALSQTTDPWLEARYDGWFAVMGCEAS